MKGLSRPRQIVELATLHGFANLAIDPVLELHTFMLPPLGGG